MRDIAATAKRLRIVSDRIGTLNAERKRLYDERLRLVRTLGENGMTQPEIAKAARMTRVAVAAALFRDRAASA